MTASEDYVTVWNSLSGAEVRRYKNPFEENLRDLNFFNHEGYFPNNFILHSRSLEVLSFDSSQDRRLRPEDLKEGKLVQLETGVVLDLKTF